MHVRAVLHFICSWMRIDAVIADAVVDISAVKIKGQGRPLLKMADQLRKQLKEYLSAGVRGLWVCTPDPSRIQSLVVEIASRFSVCRQWSRYNCSKSDKRCTESSHPWMVMGRLVAAAPDEDHKPEILVARDLHHYLKHSANRLNLIPAMASVLESEKDLRLVVLAPDHSTLPDELNHHFMVLEDSLPDEEELADIAMRCDIIYGEENPEAQQIEVHGDLIRTAKGLNRSEAMNAFAISLARHRKFTIDVIREVKAQLILKSGLLRLYSGKAGFDGLGGLDGLKGFCSKLLSSSSGFSPRGVMLLGVQGTGKSQFCKALGNESNRPVIELDVGRLMSSPLGESEQNLRNALKIADSMSPCILFVDEVEKAFGGMTSSTETDGGTSARIFGNFLTWLNDHESEVFVACSSNDISRLPPEFTRAGRFDASFFLEVPGIAQQNKIWEIHSKAYNTSEIPARIHRKALTGAEVESCCRLAAILDISATEALRYVVPIVESCSEKIHTLSSWAEGRVLDANSGEVYKR